METWSLLIAAFGGLTGLAGFVTAVSSASTAARKTELNSLRLTVESLQSENVRLRERVVDLEKENTHLRRELGLPRKTDVTNKKGLALNDHS